MDLNGGAEMTVEASAGAEKLMDDYGVFGIAGLFFAYWIAGDWTEAIIPVITIIPAKFGLVS
ncbi:MAG: hypothetical protein LBT41_01510 [Candidatus Methanoplasma sp.]|nr:hypothetical protein [Candidatus Methanoplasma sp.]